MPMQLKHGKQQIDKYNIIPRLAEHKQSIRIAHPNIDAEG